MNQAKHPEGEGRGPACGATIKALLCELLLGALCSAMWKPLHWDLGQPVSFPCRLVSQTGRQGSLGDYSLPTKGRTYREVKRNCKCDHCPTQAYGPPSYVVEGNGVGEAEQGEDLLGSLTLQPLPHKGKEAGVWGHSRSSLSDFQSLLPHFFFHCVIMSPRHDSVPSENWDD